METIALFVIIGSIAYGLYNERPIFDIICGVVLITIGIFLSFTIVFMPSGRYIARTGLRYLERDSSS